MNPKTALFAALFAFGVAPAFAQEATPFEYRSAFDGYRHFAEEEVQPWKQTNDTVREIGGWRAYAREMREPAKVPAAGEKPAESQKTADPHAGHRQP